MWSISISALEARSHLDPSLLAGSPARRDFSTACLSVYFNSVLTPPMFACALTRCFNSCCRCLVGAGSAPGGLSRCCYFAGTRSKRGLCPQGICSSLQPGVTDWPIPADKLGLGAGGERAQELISSGQGLGGCCKPLMSCTCPQGTVSGLADILSAAQTWQGRASWKGQPQQPAGAGHGLCPAPRCWGKAQGTGQQLLKPFTQPHGTEQR